MAIKKCEYISSVGWICFEKATEAISMGDYSSSFCDEHKSEMCEKRVDELEAENKELREQRDDFAIELERLAEAKVKTR